MHRESRRSFLGRAGRLSAVAALGPIATRAAKGAPAVPTALPAVGSRPSTGPIDPALKSVVAHVQCEHVFDASRVHEPMLGEMAEAAVLSCCVGKGLVPAHAEPADAWRALLRDDDVIGIKFNQVGANVLGTSVPLARQLVTRLGEAGFAPERIVLIEAPDHATVRALKTRPRVFGFGDAEVSFGTGAERLATVLEDVTAIINVPFLKTHNIAGMTGCLKNLSHALIHRPGRYHAEGCAPFVGRIVALPQIRTKLRIHLVNAIEAVYDGGPDPRPATVWAHRGILASMDPVAADQVGIDLVNAQRERVKLTPIGDADGRVAHVHAAAGLGLGTDDRDYILLDGITLG